MKHLKSKISLLLAVLFLTISCSSDDDSNNDNPITEPFFVKIDGQEFRPTQTLTVLTAGAINIEATDASGTTIIIGFQNNYDAGDELKVIGQSNGTDVFVPIYDIDNGGFFATTGTLNIATHNRETKEISGRFSFSGPDPNNANNALNFTEGEFMLSYIQ